MISRPQGLRVIGIGQIYEEADLMQAISQCSLVLLPGCVLIWRNFAMCWGIYDEAVSTAQPGHKVVQEYWAGIEAALISPDNCNLSQRLEKAA